MDVPGSPKQTVQLPAQLQPLLETAKTNNLGLLKYMRPGQVFPAQVTAATTAGLAKLLVSGKELVAKTQVQLQLGEKLTLTVEKGLPNPELRIARPTVNAQQDAISQLIRHALPRQIPRQEVQQQLTQLTQQATQQTLQSLSKPQIQQLLQQLVQTLPKAQGQQLLQQVVQSLPKDQAQQLPQQLAQSLPKGQTQALPQQIQQLLTQTGEKTTSQLQQLVQQITQTLPKANTQQVVQQLTQALPRAETQQAIQQLIQNLPKAQVQQVVQQLVQALPKGQNLTLPQQLVLTTPRPDVASSNIQPTDQSLIQALRPPALSPAQVNAQSIQNSLMQSGLFFEPSLIRENLNLGDQKFQLLQLMRLLTHGSSSKKNSPSEANPQADQARSSNSADTLMNRLLRLVEGSLARIQGQQATALNNEEPNRTVWQFELPVQLGEKQHQLPITIQQDDSGESDAEGGERIWRVDIDFSFDNLGDIQSRITLNGDSISAGFWSDKDSTAKLIERALPKLEQTLLDAGLSIKAISSLTGEAPSNTPAIRDRLLDERA